MAEDATAAVLAAVRSRILADAELVANLASSASVYDQAPEAAATPFVTLNAVSYADWSTDTTDGQEITIDCHVWHETPIVSRASRLIMRRLRVLFEFQPLAAAAPFRVVLVQVVATVGPFRDPDGLTLHGVVSLRVLADHT